MLTPSQGAVLHQRDVGPTCGTPNGVSVVCCPCRTDLTDFDAVTGSPDQTGRLLAGLAR